MSTGAIGSGHRNPWSKHLDENIKSVNEIICHLAKEKSQVFNVHPVVCLRHPAQMHHQHLEGVQDHCAVNLGKHHLGWQTLIKTGWKVLKSTCMLLATSSPCGPVFLAASTNSLLKETQIYSQMTFLSPPVQVVREKRLREFSKEKLQGSSNYCSVSAAVKSRPLILEKKGIFGEFCQSLPGPARPESSGSCWRHLQLCVESKAQQEMQRGGCFKSHLELCRARQSRGILALIPASPPTSRQKAESWHSSRKSSHTGEYSFTSQLERKHVIIILHSLHWWAGIKRVSWRVTGGEQCAFTGGGKNKIQLPFNVPGSKNKQTN